MTTYFDDIAVGDTDEFGSYDVTEEEILKFAGQYDPQPFHTDPDAAAETIYGGLIASGWHTCAMTMRLLVDGHFDDSAAMGARGVEELRFPRPVRPGDSLSVRTEILEKSVDSADRGTVRVRSETVTDDDELVLSMISEVMYARR
ncbi:MaoC family dehydratase [Halolamina sp. CBA1230]|uniref:MaoC family dehydratase n=1 Tax=Halolamina sp. CBA1230 TaxID=1853690 RepID=UPI0009A1FE10|nr:MaoC family dehydratase [Halolamina sp. CBA1230]QKY21568.1 MaoC family dehydratase [Halolamina sp. CBA1230]